jgi:hypothetical protein
VGKHLHGLHQGLAQGGRQVSDPNQGRLLLEVRTLHPARHPYTAASVTCAFFNDIIRLHGFPSSIINDRDLVFIGNVWHDLFGLAGIKLRMSTTFHPQIDGQSKVVNKVITMYLRCVTGDRLRSWVDWLSWVEYCYITSFHTTLRATPFEVVNDLALHSGVSQD